MSSPRNPNIDKKCLSSCHDQAKLFVEEIHPTSNYRKCPASVVEKMVSKGFLKIRKSRPLFVCQACILWISDAELSEMGPGSSRGHKDEISHGIMGDDLVREAARLIENKQCTGAAAQEMARALGIYISEDMKTRSHSDEKYVRVEQMLCSCYSKIWSAVQLSSSLEKTRKETSQRYLAKSVETLYSSINNNYISPETLATNLVLYYYSGSRTACNLLGHITAGGSYGTVLATSNELAQTKPVYPKGDITVTFDNNQIIGRTYRVRLSDKIRQSIVTGVTVFKDNTETELQKKLDFSTRLIIPADSERMMALFNNFSKRMDEIHRKHRDSFMKQTFDIVLNEVRSESSGSTPHPPTPDRSEDPKRLSYKRVDERVSTGTVFDQKCILVNPNSFESVTKVLDNILYESNMADGTRAWVTVVCDGQPYLLAKKLIEQSYICQICDTETTYSKIRAHWNTNHPDLMLDMSQMRRKYKSIVLRPGNGHYELNIVRSIFAIYFDIYIRPVAEMLGFKTPNALEYCKKALDHHKSWQILQIILESLSLELMRPYVIEQMAKKDTPTFKGWLCWNNNNRNRNYLLATTFVFSILHPLFLFRAGIRQCNDEVSLAAREKLSSIFYGFRHPHYQEINATDIFFLLSLPQNVYGLVGKQSMRTTGSLYGQGFDFLQEERNKATKFWLISSGPPNASQWQRATCSMQRLDMIKQAVLTRDGVPISASGVKKIDLSSEIDEARKIYRSFEVITSDKENRLSTPFDLAIPIHDAMSNIIPTSEENKIMYYKEFLQGRKFKPVPIRLHSIFPPVQKAEIIKEINAKIALLPTPGNFKGMVKHMTEMDELEECLSLIEEELYSLEQRYVSLRDSDEPDIDIKI